MKISQKGIQLIKEFEGCELISYKCPAGVWTIGYGHTQGVRERQVITQAQADIFLRDDLIKFELKVAKYDRYCWRQHEFDALVSFAYNLGSIDQLTAGGTRNRTQIADKMVLYNKAGGKVLAGLTRRRKAEQALFLSASDTSAGNGQNGDQNGIVTYSLMLDGNKQITANFKVKEFKCKDGSDTVLIDVDFVKDKLQLIRDHFKTPITINSAYRTKTYNAKVGGAAKSYHLFGQAFDIAVKGRTPAEVAKYAQTLGITGIIQYNTFVHIDSRNVRYWARDSAGKVAIVDSF